MPACLKCPQAIGEWRVRFRESFSVGTIGCSFNGSSLKTGLAACCSNRQQQSACSSEAQWVQTRDCGPTSSERKTALAESTPVKTCCLQTHGVRTDQIS